MVELVWLQFGASGSETLTLFSVSVPVLVTTIVQVAVPPLAIVCALRVLRDRDRGRSTRRRRRRRVDRERLAALTAELLWFASLPATYCALNE